MCKHKFNHFVLYTYIHRARCFPTAQVFARVSPHQKAAIIAAFESRGLVTLMCGDGTNDVSALKALANACLFSHCSAPLWDWPCLHPVPWR